MLVAAVDVGSPKNVGWATDLGATGCGDLDELLTAIEIALVHGSAIAIGFEAPLWIPRGRAFGRMTANRGGVEASMSRPWSAGAGCGALAAGVANLAWVFEALYDRYGALTCTTQLTRFTDGSSKIFVWEAFVSGKMKATTHEGDAAAAVKAFNARWPNLESAISLEPSVNLAATSLLATGHDILLDELGRSGIVVAAIEP